MRTIFIADAHLNLPSDSNYRLFLCFLKELEGNLDTLYIVGDLFDFWVGFPSNPFTHYEPVIEALERLVKSGGKIVYFEGNHDFHLGSLFSERLKTEIHTEAAIKNIQGKRLYICHGDQINRKDYSYRFLRYLFRSTFAAKAVRFFPPKWAQKIREQLQRRSHAGYKTKKTRWNYHEILMNFAKQLQQQGYEGIISGHFHIEVCDNIPNSNFIVISLGDWMEQFTFGEMENGKLLLKRFTPPITV